MGKTRKQIEESGEEVTQPMSEEPKKKKKRKEPEPEPDDDDEEEEETTDPEVLAERAAKKLRKRRLARKLSGYRKKAKEGGFDSKGGPLSGSGVDVFGSAISQACAKRLMRFVPEWLDQGSYDAAEVKERLEIKAESMPASAARETQARCEAALRNIVNRSVLRMSSQGKMRLDAATVYEVLREHLHGMMFTAVLPPQGLVRDAVNKGALPAFEDKDEDKLKAKEATEIKEAMRLAKTMDVTPTKKPKKAKAGKE
jgi:hypothetical protein